MQQNHPVEVTNQGPRNVLGIISVYWKYFLLVLLLYFPLFAHLNDLPIRAWDEARLAMNAYEMHKNHNFIVTHFEGKPDMWNTKPPFMIWTQVAFMKIFGVNELSVRLPSAIAGLFTCLLLLFFSIRYLKSFWFGFMAVMVLITTNGYVNTHVTRTGDYDAMLTLFTTTSALLFFTFTETRRNKYLYGFFACLALAVLTKSVTGLLFTPALFLYVVIRRQLVSIITHKHFYFGLLSFLFVVLGYYLLRESMNDGYLVAVRNNELGGRFLETLEGHKHGFWYYYHRFLDSQFSYWYLAVPCGMIIGMASRDVRIRRITLFSALLALLFILIISLSHTKLEWYEVPSYPFLALLVAVVIYFVFDFLMNIQWFENKLRVNVIPFIFLFLLFVKPYQDIFIKTFYPQEKDYEREQFQIGYFLKDAARGIHHVDGSYVVYDGYYAQNLFYLKWLNDKGVRISFKSLEEMQEGDLIIASQTDIKQRLSEMFNFEIIQTTGSTIIYKLHDRKNQ